jgi:hypothetical protein
MRHGRFSSLILTARYNPAHADYRRVNRPDAGTTNRRNGTFCAC